MANIDTLKGGLTDIANAIRGKTGKTGTMTLSEMPGEINGGGGGGTTDANILGFRLPEYDLSFTSDYKMLNLNNDAIQPLCSIDYTKPWEIKIRFTPIFSTPRDMTLTGTYNANYRNPSFQLQLATGRLWCGYSTNGTSWDKAISVPLVASDFTSSNTYNALFGWNGKIFYAKILDANESVLYEGELSVTEPHYQNANFPLIFGRNVNSSIFYVGDMDVSKSYIKNGGQIIWGVKKIGIPTHYFLWITPKYGSVIESTYSPTVSAINPTEEV